MAILSFSTAEVQQSPYVNQFYTAFHADLQSDEPTADDRIWHLSYRLHYDLPYQDWPAVPECLSEQLRAAWIAGRESAEMQIEADMDAAWEQESLERYDHDLSNYYAIICD